MISILGQMFGSSNIINKGMDLIDDAFESNIEKLEANTDAQIRLIEAKAKAKNEFINGFQGYKIAQRILMLLFCVPFVFLICTGIVAILFGGVAIDDVKSAVEFANSLWLGEIVLIIVGFYFGGGVVDSIKRKV